ncbi:MAG: ATP-dependent DNA helicase [bacterium]|nr:ATP-dependent DNA helicase [bacterium]
MTTKTFDELYRQLNPAQREAVDAIEGPVMVVAGPGTGKTQVLTLRIANILRKTDVPPEAVLALTFTDSGAIAMRRRLSEMIGSPAYRVNISTFHGFCNGIIQTYPEEFPRIVGSLPLTKIDQLEIVAALVAELPLVELKPFGDPAYYVRTIADRLNDLKREGVAPETFRIIVSGAQARFDRTPERHHAKGAHAGKLKGEYQRLEKRIRKNRELADLYDAYEVRLATSRRYDYSDMIMEVLRTLERNGDLLLALQEQHQYLLADEHQDANNAQNRILELLSSFHPNPNLFIVGDEKQAIFRFQGASLENFRYFQNKYPEAKLIVLVLNYRSSQLLLDAAHGLLPGAQTLRSSLGHPPVPIRRVGLTTPEAEARFVATDIADATGRGTAPEEIAVLYRDNRDAFPIAQALEQAGVPFGIESDRDLLGDLDLRKLMKLLRAVDAFGDQAAFIEALHVDFLGVPPLDIYKLLAAASKERVSVYDIARSPGSLLRIGCEAGERISTLYRTFAGWATGAKNQPLPDLVEWVIRESGFLAHIMGGPDPAGRLEPLNSFFDEVQELMEAHRDYQLHDLIRYLDLLDVHGIAIRRPGGIRLSGRVRLMTAHRSKGLEFDAVYITGATDGHWGNRRSSDRLPLLAPVFRLETGGDVLEDIDGGEIADERRLFYVALTRARKQVTVTYPVRRTDGKELLPSVFVGELRPELVDTVDAAGFETALLESPETRFTAPPPPVGLSFKDQEFIRELFMKNGLSVTALNNYLACPWRYFYTNLLRIPSSKTRHQMYGTAVHAALRDLFASAKDRALSRDALLAAFERHLTAEPLDPNEYPAMLARGTAALQGYFDRYHESWRTNVLAEFSVPGVLIAPDVHLGSTESGRVRLTGKIDKLEFLGSGPEVNVVDYKTSKPKSRGELEGATKSATGNEKRQLAFYRILLDLHDTGRYRMVSGDIDFIEPDAKGNYHRESFTIDEREVGELQQLILQTADEICSLAFWDRRCGEPGCEWCAFRELM